jgi:hypothetical protein
VRLAPYNVGTAVNEGIEFGKNLFDRPLLLISGDPAAEREDRDSLATITPSSSVDFDDSLPEPLRGDDREATAAEQSFLLHPEHFVPKPTPLGSQEVAICQLPEGYRAALRKRGTVAQTTRSEIFSKISALPAHDREQLQGAIGQAFQVCNRAHEHRRVR